MGNVLEKLRVMKYERDMGKKKNFTPYTEIQFAYGTTNARYPLLLPPIINIPLIVNIFV